MLHPTNLKQRSKKASEAKKRKNSINIIENSDDSDNASYDEVVENNDATGIIKRLQEIQSVLKKEKALFAFDNATSHATFLHDALITKHINLSSTRKQEKMCSISYFRDGKKHNQVMVFLSDYYIPELCNEAKELKKVLTERGLWPEKELRLKEVQELMSQQLDFLAQKG
ncbi:28961_t:CDS:2 [Gigaspora margarita]|uniref:28961_t:CDS:1 n=1 Tax=Gigaspora margarita TaxID=4874 RepID=A0ABN7V7K9_GIGMA|nr:28961_t:CDS:2 [Gigaspora margarita]